MMDPNEADRLIAQFLDWLVVACIFAVVLFIGLPVVIAAIEIAKSLKN